MNTLIKAVDAEFRRYKALAESAIAQVTGESLGTAIGDQGNSVAVIVRHLAGNLRSRFTDFLTSDGEKPWRKRDEEFETAPIARAEMIEAWQKGWDALLKTLKEKGVEKLDCPTESVFTPKTRTKKLLRYRNGAERLRLPEWVKDRRLRRLARAFGPRSSRMLTQDNFQRP